MPVPGGWICLPEFAQLLPDLRVRRKVALHLWVLDPRFVPLFYGVGNNRHFFQGITIEEAADARASLSLGKTLIGNSANNFVPFRSIRPCPGGKGEGQTKNKGKRFFHDFGLTIGAMVAGLSPNHYS